MPIVIDHEMKILNDTDFSAMTREQLVELIVSAAGYLYSIDFKRDEQNADIYNPLMNQFNAVEYMKKKWGVDEVLKELNPRIDKVKAEIDEQKPIIPPKPKAYPRFVEFRPEDQTKDIDYRKIHAEINDRSAERKRSNSPGK